VWLVLEVTSRFPATRRLIAAARLQEKKQKDKKDKKHKDKKDKKHKDKKDKKAVSSSSSSCAPALLFTRAMCSLLRTRAGPPPEPVS